MVDKIEEAKKLKEKAQEYENQIPQLEEKLDEAMRVCNELDEESLKAMILEEKDWKEKKQLLDEKKEEVKRLKEEVKRNKYAVQLLKEKQQKIRNEVLKEFKKKYRDNYETLLKKFSKALKKAAEIEEEILVFKRDAERDVISVILGPHARTVAESIFPSFVPILTAGPFEPENMSQYKYFIKNCKEQGINVE